MVTRRSFVSSERRQHVERARVKRVRVDPILAGDAHRAGIVTSARVVGRDRCRHRAHRIRRAWQAAKILRQVAIDLARDPCGATEQFLRRLRIELRIGAKIGEEICERALETDLTDDAFHLRANARHFPQTNFVHLARRRVRQCRVVADEIGVVGAAVRQRTCRDGAAGARRVLIGEKRAELIKSGDHGIGDRSAAGLCEARPILLRHCVREIREGRPNRRIFCARIAKTIDHLADAGRDLGRQGEAVAHALTHVRDLLAEIARHVVETRNVGFVIVGSARRV